MQSEISSFINYITVEQGLALNTQSAYRRDLEKFAKFLEHSQGSASCGLRDLVQSSWLNFRIESSIRALWPGFLSPFGIFFSFWFSIATCLKTLV